MRALGTTASIFSRIKLLTKRNTGSPTRLAEKPTVTSAGPFVELPKFKLVGALLNVTVPESATLNVRNGSLVAIDGEALGITSRHRILDEVTEYQELRLKSPVSFMLSGNAGNYSVIDIKDASWTILRDENLVSWTGFTLKLHKKELLSKMNSYTTSGKGCIVLDAQSQLFEVELKDGENMKLSPNAFVATSVGGLKWGTLEKQLKAYIPPAVSKAFKGIGSLISAFFRKHMTEDIKQYFLNTVQWMQTYLVKRNPVVLELQGPGRVLFNSNCSTSNHCLFSLPEIYRIVQKQG